MSRLADTLNLVPIYKKCYLCDFYDEDNLGCKATDVNCDEELTKQIKSEILNNFLDKIPDCDYVGIENLVTIAENFVQEE